MFYQQYHLKGKRWVGRCLARKINAKKRLLASEGTSAKDKTKKVVVTWWVHEKSEEGGDPERPN